MPQSKMAKPIAICPRDTRNEGPEGTPRGSGTRKALATERKGTRAALVQSPNTSSFLTGFPKHTKGIAMPKLSAKPGDVQAALYHQWDVQDHGRRTIAARAMQLSQMLSSLSPQQQRPQTLSLRKRRTPQTLPMTATMMTRITTAHLHQISRLA